MFQDLVAQSISEFHDQRLQDSAWPKKVNKPHNNGAWQWVEINHRFNCLLWAEEDLARRVNVADAEIAANKRAIDRYNQQRNDAIERIDEVLLEWLQAVPVSADAWLNSETAGSIIDRLSILSLKIHHMRIETRRNDVDQAHHDSCVTKLERLGMQRSDLQYCLDTLLSAASEGRAHYKVYRQFKMYNDPRLNPYLSGLRKE